MDTRTLEALADENRLAIVALLADGERCVCEISDALGISNALASHHLKRLREAGVIVQHRRGAWQFCSLERTALRDLAGELVELAERSGPLACGCCGPVPCDPDADKDETDV